MSLLDPDDDKVRSELGEEAIWRLATALSGAMAPLDIASALANEGAAAAGASFSNMALLDGKTDRVRVIHNLSAGSAVADRWAEFDLRTSTPLCEAMITGLPVLQESLEEIAKRFPALLEDTVKTGLAATASFPLLASSGVALGAVGFGWRDSQEFTADQLRRLDLIAKMAAQALERAVHYETEREDALARERADAQLIQDAFLPRVLLKSTNLDVAAVYLPASDAALGGDWYDIFPVDGGTCLVVGDVAGHGIAAAAVMAQLRNAVRAYAVQDPSPARVLTQLNRMMCRLEPGQLATAIVAVWDEHNGTILRANAGHPPTLRCRIGEFGYLAPSPQGLLLGVDPDWEYQQEIKLLRPGTTMLFYTDGLVEWRGQGIDSGMSELLACVERLDDLSPQTVCDRVLEWRDRSAPRKDDVCVVAARLVT